MLVCIAFAVELFRKRQRDQAVAKFVVLDRNNRSDRLGELDQRGLGLALIELVDRPEIADQPLQHGVAARCLCFSLREQPQRGVEIA